MRSFALACISIVLVFLSLGCGMDALPRASEVKGLRILALVANNPEVAPGGAVAVTPLVSDVAEATALQHSADVCLDPGVAFGAEPTCVGNSSRVNLTGGGFQAITTLNAGNNFTGNADVLNFTMPASGIVFAGRSSRDQFNGVPYLLDYRVRNSRGEEVRSVRRVLAVNTALRPTLNVNPTITNILADGSVLSNPLSYLGQKVSLSLVNSAPAAYDVQNLDGSIVSLTEPFLISWFVTDGSLKAQRSGNGGSSEWNMPSAAPGGRRSFVFAVLRDGRGGVATRVVASP